MEPELIRNKIQQSVGAGIALRKLHSWMSEDYRTYQEIGKFVYDMLKENQETYEQYSEIHSQHVLAKLKDARAWLDEQEAKQEATA